jgi:hypothetical protein
MQFSRFYSRGALRRRKVSSPAAHSEHGFSILIEPLEGAILQLTRRKDRRMSIRKALRTSLAILFVAGLASLAAAIAPPARAQDMPRAGVGETATAALARMSKTLLAKQFSFDSRTIRAYAGPNGELLHIAHETKAVFRRPDRLSADVTGDDGLIKMLYDGKTIVLYGVEEKKYVSIPDAGDISKALEAVEQATGTDFPLADLLSDDPGKSVLSGVTSGGQVGMATIDGARCRHFFFVQAADDLELELWLEDNDRSLPRRFVVTYRSLPGRPNFIAELSDWNFSISAPDGEFEFNPPPGVTKAELQPPPSAPRK